MHAPDSLPGAPLCAAPDPQPRKPRKVALPPLACDCHAHICGPAARYPYAEDRLYTPPDAIFPAYREMLTALGVERAVLVQPSVYGTDNRAMLDVLSAAGPRLRGIAVVPLEILESELEQLHQAGIRGVRVNAVDVTSGKGVIDLSALTGLAQRIRPLGWHMEFLLHVNEFPKLDTMFANFPVNVVIGHFGYMAVGSTATTAGFQALLNLMRDGRAWVKLTGPYRVSGQPFPHADTDAFAHLLIDACADRVVWGTDWPHVMLRGEMPNDGDLCDLLAAWIPDRDVRAKVLARNPERLYDFPAEA